MNGKHEVDRVCKMKWRGLEDKRDADAGMPLSARLQERRELIARYVPPETQAAARRTVQEISDSGIAGRTLKPGSLAPAFELPDHGGKPLSSAALLSSGPLALIFFRGRWCPFCVAQLESMNEVVAEISAMGGHLAAISPQTVHQSSLMHDQHGLRFPLLSDSGNNLARQFGLVYRVPEFQQSIYRKSFTNLPFINGEDSWELPIPAAFVIQPDGHISWSHARADYTERPEPAEILAALAAARPQNP